jgi:hypothetical protein
MFSPKCKLMFVEKTSMIAHIYPSVLQAVSGRGYAGCLDGCFQGYRGEAMQDLGYELPRNPILRGWVNKLLSKRRSSPGGIMDVVANPLEKGRCTREQG